MRLLLRGRNRAAGLDDCLEPLVIKFVFECADAFRDERLEITVDFFRNATPVFEIGITGATTRTHGSTIDGRGKAWRQFFLEPGPATGASYDLGRDITPVDTDQFSH